VVAPAPAPPTASAAKRTKAAAAVEAEPTSSQTSQGDRRKRAAPAAAASTAKQTKITAFRTSETQPSKDADNDLEPAPGWELKVCAKFLSWCDFSLMVDFVCAANTSFNPSRTTTWCPLNDDV
jgi:hypothetical protein